MAFFQEGPDGAAVAIVQDDFGADQVGAAIGAASVGAVAGDALGGVNFASPAGGGFIDDLLVGGTRGEGGAASSSGGRSGRARAVESGQIVEHEGQFGIGAFGPASHHGI